MNEAEYKAFVQSAFDGHVLIGVDRISARNLYTEISTSAIVEAGRVSEKRDSVLIAPTFGQQL